MLKTISLMLDSKFKKKVEKLLKKYQKSYGELMQISWRQDKPQEVEVFFPEKKYKVTFVNVDGQVHIH
jgi:hypothetical protein